MQSFITEKGKIYALSVGALVCIGFFAYTLFFPGNTGEVFIPEGTGVREAGKLLEEARIVHRPFLYAVLVGRSSIHGGLYAFPGENIITVVRRTIQGDFGIPATRITLPEGLTTQEFADLIDERLEYFDKEAFTTLALPHEGYLFPDTYLVREGEGEELFVEILQKTFEGKTATFREEARIKGLSFSDIVILASLLEKEAQTTKDMRLVAGIIKKRISIGMPIQIDAAFIKENGKTSETLTRKDLETDGPYNTYTRKGLPPGPIGNPGLRALDAALHPTTSPYLYYLSDRGGTLHYARTLDEHNDNKARYLR